MLTMMDKVSSTRWPGAAVEFSGMSALFSNPASAGVLLSITAIGVARLNAGRNPQMARTLPCGKRSVVP